MPISSRQAECIDSTGRDVDDDLDRIWTKMVPVPEPGDLKLVIAKKETESDDEAIAGANVRR